MKCNYFSVLLVVLSVWLSFSCGQQTENRLFVRSDEFKPASIEKWAQKMKSSYDRVTADRAVVSTDSMRKVLRELHLALMKEFPVQYDWWLQDGGQDPFWFDRSYKEQIASRIVKASQGKEKSDTSKNDVELLKTYVEWCTVRRDERLKMLRDQRVEIFYSKYQPLTPSFFAYTEGASDARAERNYYPGGGLVRLSFLDSLWTRADVIVQDTAGAYRDLDIHFDADRMLFSARKTLYGDDFHIYEMNLNDYSVKQITSGERVADIEPIYLPDENILFNSTRCGTSVDCWFTEVSNMYLVNPDGKYLRRIGFDQVHTCNPALLSDGRVVYTRWDYNDRGQVFTQPLFQMNYDGTGQTEYYGTTSWFPTTVTHVREIPGTRKIMATILGHHNPQHGKLGIIDPEAGRDENEGVTLVAPIQTPNLDQIDSWGQYTDQFQHPFPMNETEFLVSYTPLGYYIGHPMRFGIYWMNIDGERELLAYDSEISSCFPVIRQKRERPFVRNAAVDYANPNGSYYMQDVYASGSLEGVKRGDVKKLRIVEIEFRAAGVGMTFSAGKGGTSHASSAVGVGGASWDLKKVLGTVNVYPDGSAFFEVPARRPLYFQALDSNGYVIQTMRSWSTLQGGEMQSCVGCHEHKNSVPIASHRVSDAMNKGVEKITPYFEGEPRNFGFAKEIQPLLDRECVVCHDGIRQKMSLKGDLKVFDTQSRRKYSDAYINLTHARRISDWNNSLQGDYEHPEVNWVHGMGEPTLLKPYSAGAATSGLIQRLKSGHGKNKLTSAEIDHIALWIDLLVPFVSEYREAANWDEKEKAYYDYYDKKREKYAEEDRQNVEAYAKSLKKE